MGVKTHSSLLLDFLTPTNHTKNANVNLRPQPSAAATTSLNSLATGQSISESANREADTSLAAVLIRRTRVLCDRTRKRSVVFFAERLCAEYIAEDLTVTRMGYGAMQLAGPHVFGPPADHDGALAVLREVVKLGITHIDTSDFYGPHITNQLIKEALHPYPEQLRIVTKVGALRDAEGNWPKALAPDQLRQAVHDNLANLGLDALEVVNLRVGGFDAPTPGSIAEPFNVLDEVQQEGVL